MVDIETSDFRVVITQRGLTGAATVFKLVKPGAGSWSEGGAWLRTVPSRERMVLPKVPVF